METENKKKKPSSSNNENKKRKITAEGWKRLNTKNKNVKETFI
jgi:hypothetical protein